MRNKQNSELGVRAVKLRQEDGDLRCHVLLGRFVSRQMVPGVPGVHRGFLPGQYVVVEECGDDWAHCQGKALRISADLDIVKLGALEMQYVDGEMGRRLI